MKTRLKLVPTPNYEELRKVWYAKLKESGFKDIESTQTGLLSRWAGSPLPQLEAMRAMTSLPGSSKAWKESSEIYFDLAAKFLHSEEFPSPIYKLIWKLHSQGISFMSIAQRMGMTKKQIRLRIESMRAKFFKGVIHEDTN